MDIQHPKRVCYSLTMAKMCKACCTIPSRDCPVFCPIFVHLVPPGEAQTPALFWHPLCSVLLIFIWRGSEYDRAHHDIKKNARQFPFMGDRRRAGHLRRIFWLELRLVAGRDLGLYDCGAGDCRHVLRLIFSFTELTTAIPHAGGPRAYAYRAFGPTGGFIAGFATLIEFVFAPPAIAMRSAPILTSSSRRWTLNGCLRRLRGLYDPQ